MARERKVTYRSQFDGHRRLAAAVILQAIKDASAAPTPQDRETATQFLEGDMWPFSDVLDLPDDGRALEAYVRQAEELSDPVPRGTSETRTGRSWPTRPRRRRGGGAGPG